VVKMDNSFDDRWTKVACYARTCKHNIEALEPTCELKLILLSEFNRCGRYEKR